MNYKKNNKTVFYGILLITIATLMFMSAFNLIPQGLITQIISYTFIVYGVYSLLTRNFYVSFFAIVFGLKLSPIILKPILDFNQIGWFLLMFITFILATGFETLFGKKYQWRKKFKDGKVVGAEFSGNNEQDLAGEFVKASLNMGESSRYIDSKNLKEAYLSCNLGSLSTYFIDNQLKSDVLVNVDCKMGNMDLYFPADWHVVNNIGVSLGNVDVRHNQPNSEFTVYLNGNVSLGNVDVYFN